MSKKPRPSIVSSFSAFADNAGQAAPEQKAGFLPPTSGVIPPRIAAGVIGATQRTLTDIRKERDDLQAQLAAGNAVRDDAKSASGNSSQEVSPDLVDPSPFSDRLPDDDAEVFRAFKESLAHEGQKVPVEIRRHPNNPSRYQLVYGHRRWRAAKELGIPLRAVVVEIDDQGLAIAQGIENSARQDLTWIEKALFAATMDEARIKARDIRAALSVDDPELARFRLVCRTLGIDLIKAIGRAPKVGRPRWLELASALSDDGLKKMQVVKTLAAAKLLSSDERFAACIDVFAPAKTAALETVSLQNASGLTFGNVAFKKNGVQLTLDKQESEAFLAFFERELPDLVKRYLARGGRS